MGVLVEVDSTPVDVTLERFDALVKMCADNNEGCNIAGDFGGLLEALLHCGPFEALFTLSNTYATNMLHMALLTAISVYVEGGEQAVRDQIERSHAAIQAGYAAMGGQEFPHMMAALSAVFGYARDLTQVQAATGVTHLPGDATRREGRTNA